MDNLLFSYNLSSIINYLTRVQNNSAPAIDNIFVDISQFETYAVTTFFQWFVWPWCPVFNDYPWLFLYIYTYKNLKPSGKYKKVQGIWLY